MIENALKENNINLPNIAAPAASYVPYVISSGTLFVSGQLPLKDGALTETGQLISDADIERGQAAAYQCALNILAIVKQATNGDWSKVKKIVKLEILVSSSADFYKAHMVANGASDLFKELFGDEKGAHARAAYSVAALPLNASVEITAVVELS